MTTLWDLRPRAIYNSTLADTNKIADGNMEKAGMSDWSTPYSTTLTKENDPYAGSQCLRVAYNGVNNPTARQALLIGDNYRIRGRVRSDGVAVPYVEADGTGIDWTGTTSTAWQEFDFICPNGASWLNLTAIISGSGYCEFDSVVAQEIYRYYNGPLNLVKDDSYVFKGRVYGDGVNKPQIYNGDLLLWEGQSTAAWQLFEVHFWPVDPELSLTIDGLAGYARWDVCSLRKITQALKYSSQFSNFDSHIVEFLNYSSGVVMYADGVSLSTSGDPFDPKLLDGDGVFGGESLGNIFTSFENLMHGNIGELFVFNRYLSDIERETLEAWLEEKWSL